MDYAAHIEALEQEIVDLRHRLVTDPVPGLQAQIRLRERSIRWHRRRLDRNVGEVSVETRGRRSPGTPINERPAALEALSAFL